MFMLCLFTLWSLTACSNDILGEWEFFEITVESSNDTRTYRVGDIASNGEEFLSSFLTISFEEDGTGIWHNIIIGDSREYKLPIFWEKEGKSYNIRSDEEGLDVVAKLENGKLIVSYIDDEMLVTYTLVRKETE